LLYKFSELKQVLFLFILFGLPVLLSAQQTDSVFVKRADSFAIKISDSLLVKKDTVKDSIPSIKQTAGNIIKENKFLNIGGKPISMVSQPRQQSLQDNIFYTILTLIALLAFFRFFYVRYFNNLFRVFFNSSLRQSQLTDQLLQAKLPSLFFNLLSVASGGLFIYLLLKYYHWNANYNPLAVIGICSLGLAIIYLIKFITLKFTGWITGYNEVTNTYIFIIFLINKILGILLLPFIMVIAFSVPIIIKVSVLIAILLVGSMILMRFFRSYGLLQHQLKISRTHFFMYIVGIEILPVLLIYKGLILLLNKNI
jgi:hypothetical protein